MPPQKYDPLNKRNLGESVAKALLEQPIVPLGQIERFHGAGIYALYYVGGFRPYAPISKGNLGKKWRQPIYVGKAVPAGARKGGFGLDEDPGTVLYKRLKEHADSISATPTLKTDDFYCRYLVTDDIWIPLGEALLIEQFRPLWNSVLDGFGIHDPGKGRLKQQRTKWDTLHPGRAWAKKLVNNAKNSNQLLDLVEDFFAGKPVKLIPVKKAVVEEEE